MLDFHLVLSIISILVAWKWGDWRNWKSYYPTVLYMIVGDFTYIILSSNKPLWEYKSPIFSSDFLEFLIALVIFPCTCFVFFRLYQIIKNSKKIITYILFFLFSALVYTSIECLSFYLGYFSYHNGWNLYWSFTFNCLMFPLLLLHYKRPLWVWLPSIILAVLVIHLFNLSFIIIK